MDTHPGMLDRGPDIIGWDICFEPKIRLYARANKLGILDRHHIENASNLLEAAIINNLDSSFIEDDSILALIPPKKLMQITAKLFEDLESDLGYHIRETLENPDKTLGAMENFEEIITHICNLKAAFPDAIELQAKISRVEHLIYRSTNALKGRVGQAPSDWAGIDISPALIATTFNSRSIFSDLDE